MREPAQKGTIHMTNVETNDKAATAAEQTATVAPERSSSKNGLVEAADLGQRSGTAEKAFETGTFRIRRVAE